MRRTTLYILACSMLLMIFPASSCFSQVVINEVCPVNATTLQDEDGDFPDWIEIYNKGATPVNLGGFGLSDNPLSLFKWKFPPLTLAPSKFLTLFASGKDRTLFFDHWETVVNASTPWKYLKPSVEPDTNWRRSPLYNDGSWLSGPGGIGYGDGDDATLIAPPAASVYMRKVFNITDTSKIAGAVFHIDYDDAFVAYINGKEIARQNIGQNGTPVPFNTPALAEHEAKMYSGGKPEQFIIDGVFLKSFLKNGQNVLAIQVHNVTPASSDLSAIPYLSLAMIPITTTYGPVPPWFNLSTVTLHTNFKIDVNGETVYLTDTSGTILHQITSGPMQADISIGCQPDGNPVYFLFGAPTPGATNNTSTGVSGYVTDPFFNIDGGFYPGSQLISLANATSGSVTRYTEDGSTPKATSTLYTTPILADSTVVIRARSFHPSLLPSKVITNTYFINDSTSSTLPVVSVTISPFDLFDWNTGIYVKGPFADTVMPFFGANFWQDWERSSHVEYYDKQRTLGFEQDAGVAVHGNYSRSFPQKSLKFKASEEYGATRFNYQLFPQKDIHSFNEFILRNAGTDWNGAHMRDAAMHSIALKKTHSDVMAYSPSVVYLNGKYWGVYNIREKINTSYLEDNHGVDPDSIDLLQYNALEMNGSNKDFIQMVIYTYLNNLNDSAVYDSLTRMVDIENIADYFTLETYSENWDWLTNNVRYWKEQRPGAKWRWILWDLDNGMGGQWSYTANSLDTNIRKGQLFETSVGAKGDVSAFMFWKLLQNDSFRHYFINRYADLLNTQLTPNCFGSMIHRFRDTLLPEMPRHFRMWGNGFSFPPIGIDGHGDFQSWKNYQIPYLTSFINYRQITARNHIQETFNLKKQVPVTLNVNPPGAGEIKINTVTIDSFPWAGIYFDSVPVTVTALPNPGYQFSFWQSQIICPNPNAGASLTFNPDTSDAFTAYFFGSPQTPKLTISEINYNSSVSADAGDWVELHNYGAVPFDISGWKFKDGVNSNMFLFPANTVLQPGSRLVVCQDTLKFKAQFPGILNFRGEFHFGLNAVGETLRLFDTDDALYLSFSYSSAAPWPSLPNGQGYTLEQLYPPGNLSMDSSWFAGCPGGSPGTAFIPCANSGVNDPMNADDIAAVYPNPVYDVLHIDINPDIVREKEISFSLYEMTGKEVYRENNIRQDEITVSRHFPPGMYYYRIATKDAYLKTGKVIYK